MSMQEIPQFFVDLEHGTTVSPPPQLMDFNGEHILNIDKTGSFEKFARALIFVWMYIFGYSIFIINGYNHKDCQCFYKWKYRTVSK